MGAVRQTLIINPPPNLRPGPAPSTQCPASAQKFSNFCVTAIPPQRGLAGSHRPASALAVPRTWVFFSQTSRLQYRRRLLPAAFLTSPGVSLDLCPVYLSPPAPSVDRDLGRDGILSRSRIGPKPESRPAWPPASAPLGDVMNESGRGTGQDSWEVPARPARGVGGAAAAPAAGRRRSADRGAGRWEGTWRGGERQRNAVAAAAAATRAPNPPPAPAAPTINSRERSNARAGAVAPAPRYPGPQALARRFLAPRPERPLAPSPAQHHGPTRTSEGKWSE